MIGKKRSRKGKQKGKAKKIVKLANESENQSFSSFFSPHSSILYIFFGIYFSSSSGLFSPKIFPGTVNQFLFQKKLHGLLG
ncbi:hypothetical protein EO98_10180 [Methanosarcina sp. 2.H.T.1A.6]|nr:hypothetical protein EO94_16560 [Methanosarcina sp. 2.H.T.1A.3]KKG19802.1 hypothetical protein EO98_10180 [Methanosarcina sp. 2.H.T.1A.6]KKG27185.1 hypothetical protein EO96_09565 [Methanosarcina sp. 2.H.T.1A.8]KKG28928.1 hypothetical protein EO97_04740 [Methanosarcina sp. 2.H.T.1A.15]